jgi:hypothetical protein
MASEVSQATGKAEPDTALRVARFLSVAHKKTLGADKGCATRSFVVTCPPDVPTLLRSRVMRVDVCGHAAAPC